MNAIRFWAVPAPPIVFPVPDIWIPRLAFGIAETPSTSVPMRLPVIVFRSLVSPAPVENTVRPRPLPEMTLLRIVLSSALASWSPSSPLPKSTSPVGSTPRKLPSTVLPFEFSRIPAPFQRLSTNPRIVVWPPETKKPVAFAPALMPSTNTIGRPEKPGCVVPSRTVGPLMIGSGSAGWIVIGPVPTANRIVFGPAAAFAALIASFSEQCVASQAPSTTLFAELTVNVPDGAPPPAVTHAENSDVLPLGAVAVAVTASPAVTAAVIAASVSISAKPSTFVGTVRRPEPPRALAVARGVAGRARVEVDPVVRRRPGEDLADDSRRAAAGRRGGEHGEVLEVVRARVGVAGPVVRRDACREQVDPEARVPVDLVLLQRVAGAALDDDAAAGVRGDLVGGADDVAAGEEVDARAAVALGAPSVSRPIVLLCDLDVGRGERAGRRGACSRR